MMYTPLLRRIILIAFALLMFSILWQNAFANDEKEIKFGFYVDRFFLFTNTVVFDDGLNKRIEEIGNRIVRVSDRPNIKYTFRIINDPTINAYCAPGGFVYINTGLLDIIETEDELAAILAHEIGHISKKHHISAHVSSARKTAIAKTILGTLIGMAQIKVADQFSPSFGYSPKGEFAALLTGMALSEIGGEIAGTILAYMAEGYDRKQEVETDVLAIRYTQKAGYDPNALISFFKKLKSIRDKLGINKENYISNLINAEPGLEERIKNAELILNPDKNKQAKEERREE